ncbi:hypothetical protein [Paenalcaligenes sp.]|uniref:hypothetical protein n=1 Tax=Paenalcaligenes sp. TaxID=1966342 RepID=UPI00262EE0B8|nr:hypothetical protein [Paenalcaligenes sp.]
MHIQSFQWVIDQNADGRISYWETWETVRWAFHLPGNLFIELLGQFPTLANLLHISASSATGYASLNSLLSKALSLFVWLTLMVWLLNRSSRPKRQKHYLDENSGTQPLLLPMPKDYPVLRNRH